MAREALRPDADLAHETGRAGLVEDRYTRDERAAEEDGEKGLAEYSAALQAVAPILADRGAALTALPTVRRLIRFHDDEPRGRNLVPPWLADQKEAEVVRPRLELKEREFFRGEHLVHRLQEIAGVLESDDLLLIAHDELRLSQVQFFVEPGQVVHRGLDFTRLRRTRRRFRLRFLRFRFLCLGFCGLALLLADGLRLRLFLRLFLVRLLFLPLLGLVLLPEPEGHLARIPGSLVIRVVLLWSVRAIRPPATALSSWVA